MHNKFSLILIISILVSVCSFAKAERIKDICDIQGERSNPLSGFGLVVGLAPSTGDTSTSARKMLSNLIRRGENTNLAPDDFATGSIAVVAVSAELGPFDRQGFKIDVQVATLADAASLQGGTLLATELKGLDGEVYAVAQGSISTGGFSVGGKAANVSKNHQTVGRIPGGAYVEREEIADFIESIGGRRYVSLLLRNNDYTTAQNIYQAIEAIYPHCAFVEDAGTIRVRLPQQITETATVGFIAEIRRLNVKVDMPAVVVINEKTGTIVVGENVGISGTGISQGSLIVKVKESPRVSQPGANFSDAGETKVVDDTSIEVEEISGGLIPVERVVTVSELAKALNAIGATPRDLISIFTALKKAGYLQAKLEIM